ncbi:MAG: hypothetical protein J0L56_13110 [Chitinophagales bacterium]|nr:hypothetical protein [Chitinophagales bacterium]
MFSRKPIAVLAILLLFTIIYHQVFIADYAYLDEIHQLWNNKDRSNFTMFATQGRWLTGVAINKLFGATNTIQELKYLRILSFFGWILTTFSIYLVLNKWSAKQLIDNKTVRFLTLYIIVSAPVAIFIGWASCLELFIAVLSGLLSGALLFNNLYGQTGYIRVSNLALLGSLGLGIISLFFYQNAFGIFLLPFLFHYVKEAAIKPSKIVWIGLFYYLVIYLVYYFLFKYSLQSEHLVASDRTGISTNIPGKLSFFFSWPLPSAFTLNYLYETNTLTPQILAPGLLLLWIVSVFLRYKTKGFVHVLPFIAIIIVFLLLIYLPSMISKENFASYRTLFPLQLAVFWLMISQAAYFIKKNSTKQLIAGTFATVLMITGFYNYNFQFVHPLKNEYSNFNNYMESRIPTLGDTVYFIRADKKLFTSLYSIRSTGDEFGNPSTTRDWVPEPLIRQIVIEKTGNRIKAEQIKVIQFSSNEEFEKYKATIRSPVFVINMNSIISMQ